MAAGDFLSGEERPSFRKAQNQNGRPSYAEGHHREEASLEAYDGRLSTLDFSPGSLETRRPTGGPGHFLAPAEAPAFILDLSGFFPDRDYETLVHGVTAGAHGLFQEEYCVCGQRKPSRGFIELCKKPYLGAKVQSFREYQPKRERSLFDRSPEVQYPRS
jgi:hypothetical protein